MHFIFLGIVLLTADYAKSDEVWVSIKDGLIKGQTNVTVAGVTFSSFQGIPFAEPPVGELRFKAPVPKQPWDEFVDATFERGCCYQMTSDRPEETEDCLYLNVFTPSESLKDTLPVMFFIYGGGFIEGYSEIVNYGPQHLMEHGVVVVTFNYRVGPFGFFFGGSEDYPGNAGLKDQLLALQWTYNNIQNFGGDPKAITIFGQSAGSASVSYHLLSPKSRGLFVGAILESGSALSPWAYQEALIEYCYLLTTLVDSDFAKKNVTSEQMVQSLLTATAKEIDDASYSIYKEESPEYNQLQQGFFFTPTIEPEHDEAFLTKSMFEMFEKGEVNDVPVIIGFNTEECLFYQDKVELWYNYTTAFDADPNLLTPIDMNVQSDENRTALVNSLTDFYGEGKSFTDTPRNLIKYFSNQAFDRSVIKQAQLQSKYRPVYFYEFAFHGVLGGYTDQSVIGFSDDVRHGEELNYVMTRGYGGLNTTDLSKYPEIDQTVQKRVITMFTNFAKYQNPTPEVNELLNVTWPLVEPDNFQYMAIGSYLEIRKDPKAEMFSFWESLFQKYGSPPYITY